MRTQAVVRAEDSLREYIMDELRVETARLKKQEQRDDVMQGAYKYRGLTITINTMARDAVPKFTVEIGALQAIFSIESGKKLDGGMPINDIRFVEKWLAASVNKKLMMDIWRGSYDEKFVKLRPFDSF